MYSVLCLLCAACCPSTLICMVMSVHAHAYVVCRISRACMMSCHVCVSVCDWCVFACTLQIVDIR